MMITTTCFVLGVMLFVIAYRVFAYQWPWQ